MSYSRFIAERYLQATHRKGFLSFITSIAIVGVALGVAALIIALSVLGGFEQELTEKVIGFASHVQVTSFRGTPLPDYVSTTSRIEECSPLVKGVQPFVAREALIRARENVDGVFLKGIDPTRDISAVGKYIVAGTYDITRTAGGLANLVIGKKLADRLEIALGDKATIFGKGNAEHEHMRAMQFKIVGIYESGMAEYDDLFAFTSLKDAQILFQLSESVSGYDITVTALDSVDRVAERIREALGYPHYPRTIFQSYRSLFSWIELQKKPVPIVLGLIIIVATVNIIGTLLMVVLGKTKEIGILKSLGAKRRGITSIFVRQGMWIGFVGTALGNLLAFTLCYAELKLRFLSLPSDIYFMSSVPILMEPKFYIVVSLISIVLCYCCSLVPAWLAARIDPIRSIRFV
jgi:lipoprotein-releasing system permease protein